MLSPGFCSALPKQSSELASSMFPGFTWATGGATPKTYLTLSMVPRNCPTSLPEPCTWELCAPTNDGTSIAATRIRSSLCMIESLQCDSVSPTQEQNPVKWLAQKRGSLRNTCDKGRAHRSATLLV